MSAAKRLWRSIPLPSPRLQIQYQSQKPLLYHAFPSNFTPKWPLTRNSFGSRLLTLDSQSTPCHGSCSHPALAFKHTYASSSKFKLLSPRNPRFFRSFSSLPLSVVAASALTFFLPCASPSPLVSLLTGPVEFCAPRPLTCSDSPSSSSSLSKGFTPPSTGTHPSPELHAGNAFSSVMEYFSPQWTNRPVCDTIDIVITETSRAFNSPTEPVSGLEIASSSGLHSHAFYTSELCPLLSSVPEFWAEPYPTSSVPELPISGCRAIPAFLQNTQIPADNSFTRCHSSPTHVGANTFTYYTPWTSSAFPGSLHDARETSSHGRKTQVPFIPSSPRARSHHRCARPAGPSSRNLTFRQAALSRRGYSTNSPSKGKRDSASEKDDKKPPPPKRSELHPPKPAPSVWQIFFTDWLERKKSQDGDAKLNVAQAAKEAGQQYSKLTDEKREELKHRAALLKAQYERECVAWKRTLTPEDIARENAFRAAQRKSGKSRRKNINDPNAPKRPLSAYFLFLQRIRGDPTLVRQVFGEETETTRQSVLAAAKWRSMDDMEKRPYFEQAENAKVEYEAELKTYMDQVKEDEYSTVSP